MMFRPFFLFFFVLSAISADYGYINYVAKAGLNMSAPGQSLYAGRSAVHSAIVGGVGADFCILRTLSFQPELIYSKNSFTRHGIAQDITDIEVPALLKLRADFPGFSTAFYGGPNFSFRYDSGVRQGDSLPAVRTVPGDLLKRPRAVNTDFSVGTSTGFGSGRETILVDIRYTVKSVTSGLSSGPKMLNTLSVMMGYGIKQY
ncbi:MAG: hypothetical protein ACQEQV_05565 [Fibrobacterota bacterium]